MESLLTGDKIFDRLRDIKGLATLPDVMTRIMTVVADSESSAKDLAREIRPDQALTSKILKISNSAFYGFYRKIVNIEDAVVILGFQEIRSLALAITVFGVFDERSNEFFDRKNFWRHCAVTAVLADMLAKAYPDERQQAFTAGLLHDLGRAVLDQYFPKEWEAICKEVQQRKCHWIEVERELIGTDHAEIGYWLADRWAFPPSLAESIRDHHNPMRTEAQPRLTALVHLGDIVSRRDQDARYIAVPPLDQGVYQHVPLSKDNVEILMKQFQQRQAGVEALVQQLITP